MKNVPISLDHESIFLSMLKNKVININDNRGEIINTPSNYGLPYGGIISPLLLN